MTPHPTDGRELDALIEIGVFGNPTRQASECCALCWVRTDGEQIPNYSTRIDDAWAVVERMAERFFVVVNGRDDSPRCVRWPDEWHCSISPRGRECEEDEISHGYGPTAQFAICKAALAAVESFATQEKHA